ncbi:MAG: tRNA-specific 2-thiouridylase MnmA [Oscillospiraceae bacterium]|nr:tRNA-specific 2-thiouridylase MnmA [Oscillospiraceae bacterium]
MTKQTVILGLSGGVDSAVSAALLKERYNVRCVYLDIGLGSGEDAAALADRMDLPFETVDIRDALERHVCAPFAADYLAGRTPLPCARCNPLVKFPALLAAAERMGTDFVATGHYAQVSRQTGGRALLYKGMPANDQSYMLARLPQSVLQRVVFPLGALEKTAVRAKAEILGLHVAHKPDSMEICFIPDGDYARWLDRRGGTPPPGDFVDSRGAVLGRHKGIHHYTLGQRRGLGISAAHRLFVSAIRPGCNEVVLSAGDDLFTHTARCVSPNWIAVERLTEPADVTVRFRHSRQELPARVTPEHDGSILVETVQPARAPTPGQLAVFYQGDLVLGSGWIV